MLPDDNVCSNSLAIIATVLKYGHYYTKSLLLVWYIVMVFSINIDGFGLR
ncbi:hypothetical protein AOT82_1850 [Psychrobacter sp. AntiMn-1]|nr:hypothetical protein AOT82_1850 [Psychrobacter sp. AntiMn-1]